MLRRAVARPALLVLAAGAVGLYAWQASRPGRCGATVCAPNVAPKPSAVVPPTATVTFDPTSVSLPFGRGPLLTFTDQDLRGVPWSCAVLPWACFDHCDLRRADLRRADLRNVVFAESDLRGAQLEGVYLEGAVYDDVTRWPEGFDPKAHGARLDE
jgi:Pentapeptide repeats (8 copies)